MSIESFVGSNIEGIALYEHAGIRTGVARLIRRYNERIGACESDQSLRIEEPSWMADLPDDIYHYEQIDY